MFAPSERDRIEQKALEQAIRLARMARIHHEPMLPVSEPAWPFELTFMDKQFLHAGKIDPR